MSEANMSSHDVQVMITLASLCYEKSTNVEAQLGDTALATGGEWHLVWGPGLKGSNLAYIVKNTAVPQGEPGQYAVAIRGTITSLTSMLEDAEVFTQLPLPWLDDEVPMLARGMVNGWHNLSTMTSPAGFPAPRTTIGHFIGSIPSDSIVYVTGHSQGGALSTVVACWLSDVYPGLGIVPCTFAGETAGNEAFAAYFNQKFLGEPGGRYYNTCDVVPKAFAVSELESIETLYAPEPPGIDVTYLIEGLIATLVHEMNAHNVIYKQCGNDMPLHGSVVPCTDVHFWNRQQRFDSEISVQHSHFTYLRLLGAALTSGVPADPWPPASIPWTSA